MAEALAMYGSRQLQGSAMGPETQPQERPRRTHTRLAAELAIDEHTGLPIVRIVDAQTKTTLREFPPAALAAVAAKLGTVIEIGKR